MSDPRTAAAPPEETAVDDVRRVRDRLTREAGNDVQRLIQEANRAAAQLRERLGMKVQDLPSDNRPKDGTNG